MATPKHRTRPEGTYFITTNTWQRRALFRRETVAAIVEAAIFHYRHLGNFFVHRYVIMPDHLHVILTPAHSISLEKALQLIKGGSAHEIGKQLGMRFPVWQPGFTEHQIRDARDFQEHVAYVDCNPVKAKLAGNPQEYSFSSAAGKFAMDTWPSASGAKAPSLTSPAAAGLKPRPSEAMRRVTNR
jgi:putative transposase